MVSQFGLHFPGPRQCRLHDWAGIHSSNLVVVDRALNLGGRPTAPPAADDRPGRAKHALWPALGAAGRGGRGQIGGRSLAPVRAGRSVYQSPRYTTGWDELWTV